MAQAQKRGPGFYLLAAFFTLFVIFLYGPMLMIFVLSFQGTTGGLTFPMRGVSVHWFGDLLTSTRYGDLGGGLWRISFIGASGCDQPTVEVVAIVRNNDGGLSRLIPVIDREANPVKDRG